MCQRFGTAQALRRPECFQIVLSELKREGQSLIDRQTLDDLSGPLPEMFGQSAHASLLHLAALATESSRT